MKHPVPSITATMEEMPERHTWACQIMVSLDILCVSIDLRVYFLCPVIIQFNPLPPQWRRCQKGTRETHVHPVPPITATLEEMPEKHTFAGQIMVSLDILCVSIDLRVYFLCPVIIQFHRSITATMEGIPERHT